MMMLYGLPEYAVQSIKFCLASNQRIKPAVLYGSRAKGNYLAGSDIDLVLEVPDLTINDLLRFETCLDDLILAWQFDVSIYSHISNEGFREHL